MGGLGGGVKVKGLKVTVEVISIVDLLLVFMTTDGCNSLWLAVYKFVKNPDNF